MLNWFVYIPSNVRGMGHFYETAEKKLMHLWTAQSDLDHCGKKNNYITLNSCIFQLLEWEAVVAFLLMIF